MVSSPVAKTFLMMLWFAVVLAVFMSTAEGRFCPSDEFLCLDNQKCIRRSWYCDGRNDCEDGSDEKYCRKDVTNFPSCPNSWIYCADNKRCYLPQWKCDGVRDCPDGSDERNCPSGIRSVYGLEVTENNFTQYLLTRFRKQETRSISKWDTHITRIAVALFLNNQHFFAPGNKIGQEIAYELSLQLLSKLALKKKIPTNDLALLVNALTVACIDPKDFFGINMVDELRQRVSNSVQASPFSILTLCTAKDTMTVDDVRKLRQQYDAHFRPVWTDTQALVVMALSCIYSRTDLDFAWWNVLEVDERFLEEMVSDLKKKQHKNGTVDNVRTTALVAQALLAAKNYRTGFDMEAAVKYIVQEVKRNYPNIQDIYYILPIFNYMSLANVSSAHCNFPAKTDLEVIRNLREHPDLRIQVQVSVFIGDNKDVSRTWKVKVPSNYSFYQVLENIGTLEPAYKVQYSVSGGKPYVVGLAKSQDNTEEGLFWFIYTKPLSSDEDPKLIEKSPVDIPVKETEELILCYKSGFWEGAEDIAPETSTSTTTEILNEATTLLYTETVHP